MIGTVKTLYFTPVDAKSIRIVIVSGRPNIKFDFYYSDKNFKAGESNESNTYISTTISSTLQQLNSGLSQCTEGKGLCWAGMEACEPKHIKGFELLYTSNCT